MDTNDIVNNVADSVLRGTKQAAARVTDKDIKTMANLTDRNAHSEALLYLYENVLKNKRAALAIKSLIQLRDFFGHMPKCLLDLEYNEFYKPAFKQVERELDDESFKKLQDAF